MIFQTNRGKQVLIGLSGYAQSGKDHTASLLETLIQQSPDNTDVYNFPFAKPIKETLMDLFGWDERHAYGELKEVVDPEWGFSPRVAFQLFGTEFGRKLSPDLWVDLTLKKVEEVCHNDPDLPLNVVLIPDVRFPNERDAIQRNGGALISVFRKDMEPSTVKEGVWPFRKEIMKFPSGVPMHESESYIKPLRDDADLIIANDLGKEYEDAVSNLHRKILTGVRS